MKQISYESFCKMITDYYNIEVNKKYISHFNQFLIKNGKKEVYAPNNSVIVDINKLEYPYMLNEYIRNEERLINFDYIYYFSPKSLLQILREANLTLEYEDCKIDEVGDEYTQGIRYFYKEYFCEF